MRLAAFTILALGLALGIASPSPSGAVLITIDFTFPYHDVANTPQTANGSFSFDSSLMPSAGTFVSGLTPSSVSLTFAGRTYSTSDTGLNLYLPQPGALDWSFYSLGYPPSVPEFTLDGFVLPFPPTGYTGGIEVNYHLTATSGPGTSTGLWRMTTAPEPLTVSLLGAGLLSLVAFRRRPM